MADVFVSYSRADEARVETLVRALEVHGLSVWWDRSLEQGSEFGALIRRELAEAKAVIVCWSDAAAQSRWVQAEADEADNQQKYVGALIAAGRPPPPYNTLNNANLQSWTGNADDLQLLALLRDVGHRAGRADIASLAESEEARLAAESKRAQAATEVERVRTVREQHEASERKARARLASKRHFFFVINPLLIGIVLGVAVFLLAGGRNTEAAYAVALGPLIGAFGLTLVMWWLVRDQDEAQRGYLTGALFVWIWSIPAAIAGTIVSAIAYWVLTRL